MCKKTFVILLAFFQCGSCGLKLLKKQFSLRNLHSSFTFNETPIGNKNIIPDNPCPNVFEYRYDENARLYGFLEIPPSYTFTKTIDLEIDFCIGNHVEKGGEGSIALPYQNNQQIIANLLQSSPLNYKINFPNWLGHPPKITKIRVNNQVICTGEPYPLNSVPVLTTINLRHKLKMNLDETTPTSTMFDVRSANAARNPYNFAPKFPENIPEIKINGPETIEHYSGNPFLNKPLETSTKMSRKRQDDSDVCGRPIVTNALVLYGKTVPRGAFPWLVAMFIKTSSGGLEYHCTATLISTRHVLTAAHCIKLENGMVNPGKIVLVMGRLNIQSWGSSDGERIIGAEEIYTHPEYKTSSADADIALIFLKSNVIFSNFIRPICIWRENSELNSIVGQMGVVVGWGKDENGVKVSSEAKQIQLPVVSQEQCLRSNYTFAEITSERTFCAGDRSGSGPCNGDSGSGFIVMRNGRWTLRGIVSMSLSEPYTRTCDLSNYVVFTDVSKFTDWLLDSMRN